MSTLKGVCINYEYKTKDDEFQIGYMKNSKLFFIISSSVGMIMNLLIIGDFFIRGGKGSIKKR